jgi:S1-C subfamily serine protease
MEGLLVAGVAEGGPLAKAGVMEGDLIAGIQGQQLHDLARATLMVSEAGPGREIGLRIINRQQRGSFVRLRQYDVTVTLR